MFAPVRSRVATASLSPFALSVVLWLATAAGVSGQSSATQRQTGVAGHYSDYFQGRPVANGDIFDQEGLTAAHNGYIFGTRVRVTNLANDKSVIVTINDRMRSDSRTLIDLTRRAAEELDFIHEGRTRVRLVALQP